MTYEILDVRKCEQKAKENIYKSINTARLMTLCAIILFCCEKGLFTTTTNNVLLVGSVSGGTLAVISLVKSICNVYLYNSKKKELENDKCK